MEKQVRSGTHVCPWWFAYSFDNVLRRLLHSPSALLGEYLRSGVTCIDVGCGMGHFSIGMARIVGPRGRVHALDIQEKMLDVMMKRAARAGVADRIVPHLSREDSLGLDDLEADFALLFWMAHEVTDPPRLFREVRSLLRKGSRLLYAEPSFHVSRALFSDIVAGAEESGFAQALSPPIRLSRAALFTRL
jgi:ubiquinone/menaquinone biosynthesis C-methylase UbiE